MRINIIVLVVLLSITATMSCANGNFEEGVSMETRLSYEGITTLVVEGAYFQLHVQGHDREILEADISLPDGLRKLGVQVLHEQNGSELRVWVKRAIPLPGSIKDARMHFTVPAGVEVNLEGSSGSVEIGEFIGSVSAKTTSGRQRYSNIEGSLSAEATSGEIEIIGFHGILDLQATSGRLRGSDIHITGNSSFATTSGAIEFNFSNGGEDFTYKLFSTSGRIRAGGIEAKGAVATGGGPIQIAAESTSGRQTFTSGH